MKAEVNRSTSMADVTRTLTRATRARSEHIGRKESPRLREVAAILLLASIMQEVTVIQYCSTVILTNPTNESSHWHCGSRFNSLFVLPFVMILLFSTAAAATTCSMSGVLCHTRYHTATRLCVSRVLCPSEDL
ncbi:hypothetical protein EI94DRAFT_1055637 [Lactarius quietus]|nr:hypothetical protein EI94DRAFT_1055637 [Lactarius quietus]